MGGEGDYIPEDAITPMGEVKFMVTTVERPGGVRQVMLRVTEADGTLNHFPLDPMSARWLGNKLIEKADQLDAADQ
jgi:hypothetical protein